MTLDNWVTVPTNSVLTIHRQTVMIHPILDEYYNTSPSYVRSSGFVISKGLVDNETPNGEKALAIKEKPEVKAQSNDIAV